MWAYRSKIAEIGNFWYKFIPPSAIFFMKFGFGEGVPGLHAHTKFHCSGFKMWAYSPQNRKKIANFGINLPIWENVVGPQKKVNIGAQLQTFLYDCNDTIIV